MSDAATYYEETLEALREARMGWMAAEIVAEVAAGRLVEREQNEAGHKQESGLTLEEFSDEDRLAIALRIVWERAYVAQAVWTEANELLLVRLHAGVALADEETDESVAPFDAGYAEALARLEKVFLDLAGECGLGGPDIERMSSNKSITRSSEP